MEGWIGKMNHAELLERASQAQATIFEEQEVLRMILERLHKEEEDDQ